MSQGLCKKKIQSKQKDQNMLSKSKETKYTKETEAKCRKAFNIDHAE